MARRPLYLMVDPVWRAVVADARKRVAAKRFIMRTGLEFGDFRPWPTSALVGLAKSLKKMRGSLC